MNNQFLYKGRPIFIDSQCVYYIDDEDRKVCITLASPVGRTKRILVPTPEPPILNGTFTLSANGSIATINGISTDINGVLGNLRVKGNIGGAPLGSYINRSGGGPPSSGIIQSNSGLFSYIIPLVDGFWNQSNSLTLTQPSGASTPIGSFIDPITFILTIPTETQANSIILNATDTSTSLITSDGTCNSGLIQGFVSNSPTNGFVTELPVVNGNSIGIANAGATAGWKASVISINPLSFDLEFTRTGVGIGITTNWTIN